ncbi:MAG TPA: C40 family peptidase [Gemmatimonadales bacterium]|nr:C40 family peptidase [Gemmatimonadales bacterium]
MRSVIARAAIAPLCREPSLRSEQVSQLVLGETATIEERRGDWRRVTCDHDGYGGWAHVGYLTEVEGDVAAGWRESARGWSLGAVLAVNGSRVRVPLRARLALDGDGVRLPDGRRATLVEGAIPPADELAASARETTARHWGLQYLAGTAYQWGGVTAWGVDCSGFVQTAFAARGVAVPRDASLQAGIGSPAPPAALCPGDLLFFRGDETPGITHVAFAAESDTLIHSTVACGGVLQEPWLPGTRAGVLRERLVAVRRLDEGG